MSEIKEEYVSFETAKLLKEKGFDEICYACYEYFESGVTLYKGWTFEYKGKPVHNSLDRIKCPTLQMAMKWIREKYQLSVEPYFTHNNSFSFKIQEIPTGVCQFIKDGNKKEFQTYEEACESALQYCLTKLL